MLEIKYYLYKKNEMIGLEDILITSGSIKALLLLLSPNLLPKDNLDDFLNNDLHKTYINRFFKIL